MITIRYFGVLQDALGCTHEQLPWTGGDSAVLLEQLRARGEIWQQALAAEKIFKIALNEEIMHEIVDIPDGADVAILPPVTGG